MNALPYTNSTAWIGLPVTAESQLRSVMALRVLSNVSILQQGLLDDASEESKSSGDSGATTKDKKRLLALSETVTSWLAALPTVEAMPNVEAHLASDAAASPLDRCMAREIIKGRATVALVRKDLQLVQ